MSNVIQITLIAKPGCHLCDDARIALSAVVAEFEAAHRGWRALVGEVSILDDTALALKHSEEIPVVFINGKMHSYWHVDSVRLMASLEALTA